MLWKKSRILGKILEALVGIGAGLKFRPVRVSLLSYSRRNVVDFLANEFQFVFAVGNTGLPFTTDVTFHLWKKKRKKSEQIEHGHTLVQLVRLLGTFGCLVCFFR